MHINVIVCSTLGADVAQYDVPQYTAPILHPSNSFRTSEAMESMITSRSFDFITAVSRLFSSSVNAAQLPTVAIWILFALHHMRETRSQHILVKS